MFKISSFSSLFNPHSFSLPPHKNHLQKPQKYQMNKNKANLTCTGFLTSRPPSSPQQLPWSLSRADHTWVIPDTSPASHSDRFQQQQPSHVPGVEQAKRHRPKLFLTQIYKLYTKEPVSNLLSGWELTFPVML